MSYDSCDILLYPNLSYQKFKTLPHALREKFNSEYSLFSSGGHFSSNNRFNGNSSIDETDDLIDGLCSLMVSQNGTATVHPSAITPSIYVSVDSVLMIKQLLESFTNYSFTKQEVFTDYFRLLLENHEMASVLVSVDGDFGKAKDLNSLFFKFKESYQSTLISHVLVQCLLLFKNSLNEELINHQKFELNLPTFKLEKFSLWNTRNELTNNEVNNILPNSIIDVILTPFQINDINVLNNAYIYNCLVHYVCHQEDISTHLNLIWYDKLSKLKLNDLIYFRVFKKLDPNFVFISQTVETDIANKSRFIKQTSLNYFSEMANRLDLSLIFNTEAEKQTFENYITMHLNYHRVSNLQDLLQLFCFFYDLPIASFVERGFSKELFEIIIKFFDLRAIEPDTKAKYEDKICVEYLKYLRFKTFLLHNDVIGPSFCQSILDLERLLNLDYDFEMALSNFSKFFRQDLSFNPGFFDVDCLENLMELGLDTRTIKLIDFFGYYEYIVFR